MIYTGKFAIKIYRFSPNNLYIPYKISRVGIKGEDFYKLEGMSYRGMSHRGAEAQRGF